MHRKVNKTSSVIFTEIAEDNQINACIRTMDKRCSELDDALKQHAQKVGHRATDDLRAKVGSDLHLLNQSMQGASDSTVDEIDSAMKQLCRCGAAASRRARGLPDSKYQNYKTRARWSSGEEDTCGGRSSDLITSKLLSRQSPSTTTCQSKTGEREQLSAGGTRGSPPQGCPRVVNRCKDPFRLKLPTAKIHFIIIILILIIMNRHTLLA